MLECQVGRARDGEVRGRLGSRKGFLVEGVELGIACFWQGICVGPGGDSDGGSPNEEVER